MRSIQEIVAANRKAVQQGNIKAGKLDGTANTKVQLWDVVATDDGTAVAEAISFAEAGRLYRDALNSGGVELVPHVED